ncbi:HlyD family efflux transporter periplasmic adaptor subunit [Imbroritus primus]|uniref:HlyD family efflux transporter periplasmic adaptor subunit n=1 Tax=Imbroritus primus TaxID=3058603 RepID=A0ACD3SVM4_9BURK|nr:HlyD family efflux transporter periplasmic adaptor subunit [Burkholderiaceae bacterium PBA]
MITTRTLILRRPLAALVLALGLTALAPAAMAGPGHDHGDAPPAANSNGPKRQPDGSVFLPKPAQRQLAVRTLPVQAGELPKAFELQGRVVMDPNAGGKVQAALAGRLEAGPNGLPSVGQPVRKGQVLAYVAPSSGALERAGQVAQQAELRAAHALALKRQARLRELADTVPLKEIEAAESEVASLAGRLQAVGAGLSGRDTLGAPVTGVIASANAVAGQVVDAGALVFEVVDPRRVQIEALAYDAAQAQNIASASMMAGESRIPLTLIGAARSLRDQALPVMFGGAGDALSRLAVGQPVQVVVQSRERLQGVRVPVAALLKNPANQDIVWIKTAPERFEPRPVTFVLLDGASVAVTTGLEAGARVVTGGATLINQVR